MHSLPVENSAATRAALLGYLTHKLAGLFPGNALRGQLADLLAPLSNAEIARSLKPEAEATCERLTAALLRDSVRRDPASAAADLVAVEFPQLPAADRARLAEFTRAVRDLSTANDGVILDRDFLSAGFGVTEAARLLPKARRVLSLLDEAATLAPAGSRDEAAQRLIEAGVRAGLRFNPDALALAPAFAAA